MSITRSGSSGSDLPKEHAAETSGDEFRLAKRQKTEPDLLSRAPASLMRNAVAPLLGYSGRARMRQVSRGFKKDFVQDTIDDKHTWLLEKARNHLPTTEMRRVIAIANTLADLDFRSEVFTALAPQATNDGSPEWWRDRTCPIDPDVQPERFQCFLEAVALMPETQQWPAVVVLALGMSAERSGFKCWQSNKASLDTRIESWAPANKTTVLCAMKRPPVYNPSLNDVVETIRASRQVGLKRLQKVFLLAPAFICYKKFPEDEERIMHNELDRSIQDVLKSAEGLPENQQVQFFKDFAGQLCLELREHRSRPSHLRFLKSGIEDIPEHYRNHIVDVIRKDAGIGI